MELRARLDRVLWHLALSAGSAAAVARDRPAHAPDDGEAASASTCCASSSRRSRRSWARTTARSPSSQELRRGDRRGGHARGGRAAGAKELRRLERMPEAAAEYGMVRTYLEWLIELPWRMRGRAADRHRRGAPGAGRGPLRPREDQAPHPRVPGGAQAEPEGPRPDPVLRRPARRRQDLARPEHRARDGRQVRARKPRRRARRGARSAATGAPISARCRATSSRRSARPARATA